MKLSPKKIVKSATKAISSVGKSVGGVASYLGGSGLLTSFGKVISLQSLLKDAAKPVETVANTAANVIESGGKAIETVTKPVIKTAEKVAEPVVDAATNVMKSSGKAVETAISGTAKLLTGDVSGALDKYGRTITNAANVATAGTIDVTGRKEGIINVDAPKYTNAILGKYKLPEEQQYESSKGSGRITLRTGKGLIGGGSAFAKAKYPLGGSTGKAGK